MNRNLHELKKLIETEVFVTKNTETIVHPDGREDAWLFDFRRVLFKAGVLEDLGEFFWSSFAQEPPFQIGGVEVAAIPLITALVLTAKAHGAREAPNGFFIRKSRKREGLMRMIEGALTDDPIILVDDILNSGKSFIRQVEVIEALGKKVHAVFAILRFRDLAYYRSFTERGIRIVSLFTLDDFKDSLDVANLVDKAERPVPMPFTVDWCFKSENPNYHYVVPKSAPALDEHCLYFGSDSGNVWALRQSDGSVVWNYKVGFHAKGKYILSSPAMYKDMVYFGAYDGNLYALDKATGERRWVFMDADWIGSSPCIAPELGMVYVGLEFGLWNRRGGIVALDAETGKKRWEYCMAGLVHSSPGYSEKHGVVVCGSNDYAVYGFDARTGKRLWEFKTGGEVKASFAFDDQRGIVCFGSHDAYAYVLETKTGATIHTIKTEEAIYSTPLVYRGHAYIASLDKTVYCVNLETGAVVWRFPTNGRIFASPDVIGDRIYIGSNDGRLYELDPITGKNTAFFQATERITNKIAYNGETRRLFLPTFANEMYCLMKQESSPSLLSG